MCGKGSGIEQGFETDGESLRPTERKSGGERIERFSLIKAGINRDKSRVTEIVMSARMR